MVPIKHCSASAATKKKEIQEEPTCTGIYTDIYSHTHTHAHTILVHTKDHASYSLLHFFPALMDPITLSKTANTVPYGEPIEMEIQLFLMDTLSIINLWGEKIFQTNCDSRG